MFGFAHGVLVDGVRRLAFLRVGGLTATRARRKGVGQTLNARGGGAV